MKTVKYELKKLFSSKAMLVMLAALVLASAGVCCLSGNHTSDNIPFDEYRNGYTSDIERVIRRAEQNKVDLSGGGIGYLVRYQEQVIEKYTAILDGGKLPRTVTGYDEYILYSGRGFILILLAAVIFGAAVSLHEKDAGMLPFLRLGKRSRAVFASKLAVLFILSVALSFINSVFVLIITGARWGFDNLFAPLVSIQSFEFCPYDLTIFGYICILFCLTTLIVFMIALLSAFFGKLTGSWLVTILCGGTMVSGVYSSGFDYNAYFVRYRAVNIFEQPFDVLPVTLFCCFAMLVAVCLLFCLISVRFTALGQKIRNVEKRIVDWLSGLNAKLCKRKKPRRIKWHSLYVYELKKIFISSGLLFLVILILGTKMYFILIPQKSDPYESEYRQLCSEFSGELTDDKSDLISNTLADCNEVLSRHDSIRNSMMQGYITHDEYDAYMQKYYEADIKKSAFERLAVQRDNIMELRQAGKSASIVYDTGWHSLFFAGIDGYLYALLLFLFAGIYTFEYKCGFGSLVPGIGNGWRKLDRVKRRCAVSVTMLLFIIFAAIDIISVCTVYPLVNGAYSLCSLIGLSALPDWLSLSAGFVLLLMIKLFIWMLFSLLVCILSKKLRKLYLVVPVTILLTLVPYTLIN